MSLYLVNRTRQRKFCGKEESLPGTYCFLLRKGAPRCPRWKASFTLEAAVVLPLLACFFVSLLFFFRVMQIQIVVQKALNDTGRQMAVLAAAQENGVADIAAAQTLFLKELGELPLEEAYISGGKWGISLLQSEFDAREVRLRVSYEVRLPLRIFWVQELAMEQHADCRKWNGWKPGAGGDDADLWVYITETGSVYHSTDTCTHLELSIRSVKPEQIDHLRNENGAKYYACSQCADQTNGTGSLYITNQGDRYHRDLNCSGIKRTVYMVRLSEVGARTPCRRCGAPVE